MSSGVTVVIAVLCVCHFVILFLIVPDVTGVHAGFRVWGKISFGFDMEGMHSTTPLGICGHLPLQKILS